MIAIVVSTPMDGEKINHSFVLLDISQDKIYEISDGDDWHDLVCDIEREFCVYADNWFLNIDYVKTCEFLRVDITKAKSYNESNLGDVSNINIMFKILEFLSSKGIDAINCEITSELPTEEHVISAAINMINELQHD